MEYIEELPKGSLFVDKLFRRKVLHNLWYNPETKTLYRKYQGNFYVVNNKKTISVRYLTKKVSETVNVADILKYLDKHYLKNCSESNTRIKTFSQYIKESDEKMIKYLSSLG